MLFAAICLLAQPRLVNVEIAALPATKAVAEISKSTGVPLYTSPEVGVDIVCVRAKHVELADLKQQLAQTIGAVWENRQGKETLARPVPLASAQEAQEYEAKAREIERLIAARPPLTKFTEAEAAALVAQSVRVAEPLADILPYEQHDKFRRQLWALRDQEPATRMLDRIIRRLDPRVLARIESGQPIVFSDKPTRKQLPLDRNTVEGARAGFAAEQALLRQAVIRANVQKLGRGDDSRLLTWEAEPQFNKVTVKVDLNRQSGMPRFTLRLADEDGDVRALTIASLRRPASTPAAKSWPGELSLSPEALAWKRLYLKMIVINETDDETKKPIAEAVAPYLDKHSRPEKFEPLSFAAGAALLSFAESQDKNLVACIPDQALVWYEGSESMMSVQLFTTTAETTWQGVFETDGPWIRYRPMYLSEGRRNRLNREALGKYFRAARDNGTIRIDNAAQYAYATSSPLLLESWDRTAVGYTERLQGEYASGDLAIWYYRAPLKFLGALAPQQRATLLQGGKVPYLSLGSNSRRALDRYTYGETFVGRGIFATWVPGEEDSQKIRGNLREEATEALGNGIPGTTVVSGATNTVPMLVYRYVNESVAFSTAGSPKSTGGYVATGSGSNRSEYFLGSALSFRFEIDYGGSLVSKTELAEIVNGRRNRYADWKELPAELKRQFEAGLREERERLDRERNRLRTTPPP